MKIPSFLFVFARLGFTAFVMLTASYCLLTYIPFTYHQINLGGVFPWVTTFVKIYAYLYWAALALVAFTLLEDLKDEKTKLIAWGFLAVSAGAGIVLLFYPWLAELKNDATSFVWSLAALVPLFWVAAIDWLGHGGRLKWAGASPGEDSRVFRAAWQSALFLSLLYAAIVFLRFRHSPDAGFSGREELLVVVWSILYHLLIFMAVFVAVTLLRALASLSASPCRAEFLFCTLASALLVTLVVSTIIFPPISFGGPLAILLAVTLAAALVVSSAGLSARLYGSEDGPVDGGLALLLRPLSFGRFTNRRTRLVSLLLITVAAFVLAVKTPVMDWNYLLQKVTVLLVWVATFTGFYALAPHAHHTPGRTLALLGAAAASLFAYEALLATEARWKNLARSSPSGVTAELDRYAGYDVSFKLIHDMLAPLRSGNVFYRFLTQNTNIPQSVQVKPVEVKLVDNLTNSTGPKPHIFLIVIDSLRRDYLASYNPGVTFTPATQAFGRESTVMENAFTRYGGTGLSEPSIWVGGMILHKQYIMPFYPMNSLQKLLETEKYQSYVSKDPILSVVLGPSPSLIELDKDIGGMNYDLCKSLRELTQQLTAREDKNRPVFAYTQAQNIHISVINREGRTAPPGESYPGFDAAYASRLRKIDGCFGDFVNFLKTSGLYDRSIVILTSDHGDSLGEGGRWGHAYTLYPEIVRIPLIIHLPTSLTSGLTTNTQAMWFLTDLTPSLYYLLGHRPIVRNEIFGRSIFTASATEQTPYLRDSYMVASSYGPVYGILKNGGRALYVIDAVNYQDYFFTLGENLTGTSAPVTSSMRNDNERLIRNEILAVNNFYHFGESRE